MYMEVRLLFLETSFLKELSISNLFHLHVPARGLMHQGPKPLKPSEKKSGLQ
jgi:hypothetical protein